MLRLQELMDVALDVFIAIEKQRQAEKRAQVLRNSSPSSQRENADGAKLKRERKECVKKVAVVSPSAEVLKSPAALRRERKAAAAYDDDDDESEAEDSEEEDEEEEGNIVPLGNLPASDQVMIKTRERADTGADGVLMDMPHSGATTEVRRVQQTRQVRDKEQTEEPTAVAPPVTPSFTDADDAELAAVWAEIDGGDGTLNPAGLREVFKMLGRSITDDAFEEAFQQMDGDGSGLIEFDEFVVFYRSQSDEERLKIRKLKAEAELRRRLVSGLLSASQEVLVRNLLGDDIDDTEGKVEAPQVVAEGQMLPSPPLPVAQQKDEVAAEPQVVEPEPEQKVTPMLKSESFREECETFDELPDVPDNLLDNPDDTTTEEDDATEYELGRLAASESLESMTEIEAELLKPAIQEEESLDAEAEPVNVKVEVEVPVVEEKIDDLVVVVADEDPTGGNAALSAAPLPPALAGAPRTAASSAAEAEAAASTTAATDSADDAELAAVWAEIDGGDGTLNPAGLREVFKMLGRSITDDAFEEAFQQMDGDGSGLIEFDEFVVFYRSQSDVE